MKKYGWSDFNDLRACAELEEYFNEERPYSHSHFFHYTSLNAINGILSGKWWISCVSRFNDERDKEQFGDSISQKRYYSICFSTGDTENLPLWYLYSGIFGDGGRIRLTLHNVKKLMCEAKFDLYESIDGKPVKCVLPLDDTLMSKKLMDVVYYVNKIDHTRIKYNTMVINEFPIDEFQLFQDKYKGFTKDAIWFYEKETRFTIELSDVVYEQLDRKKDYVIVATFSLPKRGVEIGFAPAIGDIKEVYKHVNIKNYIEDGKRYSLSEHAGKVKFDLCKNKCKYGERK